MSFKNGGLTDVFPLLEVAIALTESFLFVEMGEVAPWYLPSLTLLLAAGFYTLQPWQLIILALLQPAGSTVRAFVFETTMNGRWVTMVAATTFWCCLCLFSLHLWLKHQVLKGTEQSSASDLSRELTLFDALSEGLILIDKQTFELRYMNKAAKTIDENQPADITKTGTFFAGKIDPSRAQFSLLDLATVI